jgi:hypothetical protein
MIFLKNILTKMKGQMLYKKLTVLIIKIWREYYTTTHLNSVPTLGTL